MKRKGRFYQINLIKRAKRGAALIFFLAPEGTDFLSNFDLESLFLSDEFDKNPEKEECSDRKVSR